MTHPLQILIDRGVITVDQVGVVRLTEKSVRIMLKVPTLHFVGFKNDRYLTAVKVWGKPDFIHRFWDVRATHEVCEGDIVVFANGDEHSQVQPYAYDDSAYF
jgi:hypothetical protein